MAAEGSTAFPANQAGRRLWFLWSSAESASSFFTSRPCFERLPRRVSIVTLHELSETRGIAFVDIFDLSRRAAMDPSLVANDGLHPSGAQYALWVDRIGPVVRRLLTQSPES